eukprot:CAMPEP_0168163550 /NCGR_PEP_ID=MMETSP0139_2-20121125/440_1 /TAXON_ID=44445 /ORGANISM="Pseudo-nitzschia australis, Strain 10249 10 AB" /LENGTH=193 /DNA_ID=CAMNT_0008080461 /DNA_START=140 /DNA_END=721 /DNA_ORIENTATION=+
MSSIASAMLSAVKLICSAKISFTNAGFKFREERFWDKIARPPVCKNPSSASHPGGCQNCNCNWRGREHCNRNRTGVHCGQVNYNHYCQVRACQQAGTNTGDARVEARSRSRSRSHSRNRFTDQPVSAQLASFENVILQHPTACPDEMDTEHSFSLIWDSGASACIMGDKSNFKGGNKPHNGQCKGICSDLEIE